MAIRSGWREVRSGVSLGSVPVLMFDLNKWHDGRSKQYASLFTANAKIMIKVKEDCKRLKEDMNKTDEEPWMGYEIQSPQKCKLLKMGDSTSKLSLKYLMMEKKKKKKLRRRVT